MLLYYSSNLKEKVLIALNDGIKQLREKLNFNVDHHCQPSIWI